MTGPTPLRAAHGGLCPSCGASGLFASRWSLTFAPRCAHCDLDFQAFNVGDGAAALLIIPLGALMVAGALLLHFKVGLPLWLQPLIWIPLACLLTFQGLRWMKAWLLRAEFRQAAREGRRVG